jgi:hypothetical protein
MPLKDALPLEKMIDRRPQRSLFLPVRGPHPLFHPLPRFRMDFLQVVPFLGIQLPKLKFSHVSRGNFLQFGWASLPGNGADLGTGRLAAILFFKFVDLLFDLLPALGESLAQFLRDALDLKSLDLAFLPYLLNFVAQRFHLSGQLVLIDLPRVPHRLQHPVFMESEPFP